MSSIHYIAQRNLALGHAIDVEYFLALSLNSLGLSVENHQKPHRAIGGASQIWHFGTDHLYTIRTTAISDSDLPAWQEFLHSVTRGETFTLNLADHAGGPAAAFDAVLDSPTWQIPRLQNSAFFAVEFVARSLT